MKTGDGMLIYNSLDAESQAVMMELSHQYLLANYDYVWLKAMMGKCASQLEDGATLITGSSHALNGVDERAWRCAVNCSMHSQDIYYDFLCARKAVAAAKEHKYSFARCLIVMGYYIAFQDLSRSTKMREWIISDVYYPLFGDAHNWQAPIGRDPWQGCDGLSEKIKLICEELAEQSVLKHGTYYSEIKRRGTFFDFKGRAWSQLTPSERYAYGKHRAESHNASFKHGESYRENCVIFKEFIQFLYDNNITPILVIPPFTVEYNQYVLPEMKEALLAMVDSVPEDVHYVDFNVGPALTPDYFMDTDHLNAQGATLISEMLAEAYGM